MQRAATDLRPARDVELREEVLVFLFMQISYNG